LINFPLKSQIFQFFALWVKKNLIGSVKKYPGQSQPSTLILIINFSTNMNATSSRAHTIVGINFIQRNSSSGKEMAKGAIINLVDLAGRYLQCLNPHQHL